MFKWALLLMITLLLTGQHVYADEHLPAFPGAEGAAKYTPGGRGGEVYHVTNTNPSGEGSLAHGIETAEVPRTIVFDTGGTIHFDEALEIEEKKNLTVAGQTAPGDGVTLRFDEGGLRITDSEDIVVTHLRIANGSAETQADNLRTDGSKNVTLSHVSIRWGARGNFVSRPGGPLTAQYLMNAEPTGRQLAGWFGHMRQEEGLYNQTVRKNLGIHQGGRLNMFQQGRFEFINNITFNGESRRPDLGPFYIMSRPWHGTAESDLGPQIADLNVIGNVLIDGLNPPAVTFGFGRASRVYIDGNMRDRHCDTPFSPEPEDGGFEAGPGPHPADEFAQVELPLDLRLSEDQRTQPISARQAYIDVLSRGGASAVRDKHDHRYIRDVMNKNTRELPENLDDIPGEPFPELDEGQSQQISAGDGIPDTWKEERGLDPEVAYHQEYTEEGYTYLEKYLHWRMRHSLPPDASQTEEIMISSTDGEGGYASVSSTEQHQDAGTSANDSFIISKADGIRQYGLVRFDLSKVEPGMLNDATLELALRDDDGAGRFQVYGFDHGRDGQVWPDGSITANVAPPLKNADNSIEMIRDEVILLGDLEIEDGVANLTNPNLAVFLNLAMYDQEHPESELVTLVFKPMQEGKANFFTGDNAGDGFAPRLIVDARPKETH